MTSATILLSSAVLFLHSGVRHGGWTAQPQSALSRPRGTIGKINDQPINTKHRVGCYQGAINLTAVVWWMLFCQGGEWAILREIDNNYQVKAGVASKGHGRGRWRSINLFCAVSASLQFCPARDESVPINCSTSSNLAHQLLRDFSIWAGFCRPLAEWLTYLAVLFMSEIQSWFNHVSR